MKLTDKQCRNAKATDKDLKLSDGCGLFLLTKTNGKKYWHMSYRFSGKQKLLSFGPYATISIETTQEAISVDTTTAQGFFTRQEHTLGFGLADLDALIQKIGGYIQISSVPNSGTKATIYWPSFPSKI